MTVKELLLKEIESLPDSLLIEQFTKTEDGKWLLSVHSGEDAVLSLSSVEFQISLADIYENVEFE